MDKIIENIVELEKNGKIFVAITLKSTIFLNSQYRDFLEFTKSNIDMNKNIELRCDSPLCVDLAFLQIIIATRRYALSKHIDYVLSFSLDDKCQAIMQKTDLTKLLKN